MSEMFTPPEVIEDSTSFTTALAPKWRSSLGINFERSASLALPLKEACIKHNLSWIRLCNPHKWIRRRTPTRTNIARLAERNIDNLHVKIVIGGEIENCRLCAHSRVASGHVKIENRTHKSYPGNNRTKMSAKKEIQCSHDRARPVLRHLLTSSCIT